MLMIIIIILLFFLQIVYVCHPEKKIKIYRFMFSHTSILFILFNENNCRTIVREHEYLNVLLLQ